MSPSEFHSYFFPQFGFALGVLTYSVQRDWWLGRESYSEPGSPSSPARVPSELLLFLFPCLAMVFTMFWEGLLKSSIGLVAEPGSPETRASGA